MVEKFSIKVYYYTQLIKDLHLVFYDMKKCWGLHKPGVKFTFMIIR